MILTTKITPVRKHIYPQQHQALELHARDLLIDKYI